ncbi:hypothetical protein ACOMHN_033698 [Nucella lapillus]
MKFFSRYSRVIADPDRANLLDHYRRDSITLTNDCNDDHNIDEEEEDNDDIETNDESNMCEKCQRERGDVIANFDDQAHASSADVIEICVVEDGRESREKKKKKPLKKRVRKGVWRAMRSSWKYLRRGMTGYAPGLGSLFTWGVNFNQVVSVRTSAKSPYF